ncbi:hypothetical protein [Chamaesiphon sp. VAR_48_metabat_135_sub]|uniref:hypothetical protein n=1 Tax=Chamaesiphon sp. VAR_48_metabat_135_sub TaxID=2964699 RepID=UPI00286AA689|nr:hypothetical protein [Chamaesiphon sp. VAR_48_metabat_135_sub]
MDYIWTDKEIDRTVIRLQKFQDSEEWLSSRNIRSGNKPKAPDYRKLMAKLVELEHAFDNEEDCESDTYRISINWEKKDEMLASLKASKLFFSPALLCQPDIINLPPREAFRERQHDVERLLGRQINLVDRTNWVETKSDWSAVYEILCNFQTTGKFTVGTYGESLNLGKEKKKWLLLIAEEVACMYKAIECGCTYKEIQVKHVSQSSFIKFQHLEEPAEAVANEYFLELLTDKSWNDFIIRCLHPGSSSPRAEHEHFGTFIKSWQQLEELLSNPVTGDGSEAYEYELKDANEDFWRASRLIRKKLPLRLMDFGAKRVSEPAPQPTFLNRLLASSIPEVVEKAQMWADARQQVEHLKITQGYLRRHAEQRRSQKRK